MTSSCFLSQSISRQRAAIAQAAQLSVGTDLNLSCIASDAWSRFYLYDAFVKISEEVTLSAVAAGTAFTLTNAYAPLDFGTTDPVITFDRDGTYLITADVGTNFVGATFAALQTASFKIRRTNNTPADIGTPGVAVIPVMTTTTLAGPSVRISALYTATAGDIITIQGVLSAAPSAGSVTASSAKITSVPNR